jgi:Tol biopolymer transport system component
MKNERSFFHEMKFTQKSAVFWISAFLLLFVVASSPAQGESRIQGKAAKENEDIAAHKEGTPAVVEIPAYRNKITNFKFLIPDRGGRVDWHPTDNTLVALDLPGPDGFHDVYTLRIDGSELRCLTCDVPGLPQRQNGNPEWHPSGRYIVFQSEEPEHYNMNDRWFTYPGIGGHANLWAVSIKDGKVYKLTDYRPFMSLSDRGSLGAAHAVLHPHFNDDGTKLVWTMRYGDVPRTWGKWKIVMADFIVDDQGPRLENVRDVYKPGPPGWFVECMGFRPGKNDVLALNGNIEGQDQYGMDIYQFNWRTQEIQNLTKTPTLWEEDLVYTKDGRKILFMSNLASGPLDPTKPWTDQPRTREYYLMNADDGSGLTQVTHFNVPGWPEYQGGKKISMSDCSFSPDGRKLVFLYHEDTSPDSQGARLALRIALLEFEEPVR